MNIWTCRNSPHSGSRNVWTCIKDFHGASRLSKFGIFSARSKWYIVTIVDHGRNLVTSLWPGDKSTINGVPYNSSSRSKISECKNPLLKFSCRYFWDQDGVLFSDYLPKGQTINVEYCPSLLVHLEEILKEKRLGKFIKCVLFLHDNPPAHRTHTTYKKLPKLGFHYLDHPPYSPDLALSDYHLFPWPKKQLKVRHYSSNSEVFLPWRPGWKDNILIFF